MTFAIPSDLRQMVLYWWKIIDQPSINIDDLYNFIAFDLYLDTFENAKIYVQKAINSNFLIENEQKETIQLSNELESEFNMWQEEGRNKAQKARSIINQKWNKSFEISDNLIYDVCRMDLLDNIDIANAGRIRSSFLSIDKLDFTDKIAGKIKDKSENGKEIIYPFIIDIRNSKIIHECPEYSQVKKNQKKFCRHLGRVLMKLYSSEKTETINLIKKIVNNKDQWEF